MLRVRVALTGSGVTGPAVTTLYFLGTASADAVAAALAAHNFFDACKARISNTVNWSVEQGVAQLNEADGSLVDVHTAPAHAGAGTDGVEIVPRSVQGHIRWVTQGFVDGRRVIGHTYLPGVTEFGNLAGSAGPEYLATMGAAASALETAAPGFIIWSRPKYTPTDPPALVRPGSLHPVTGGTVTSKFASLKSRRD